MLAALFHSLSSAEGRARAERMARRGLEAAPWFQWAPGPKGALHSAIGLFLVELMHRAEDTQHRANTDGADRPEPREPPATQAAADARRLCAGADLTTLQGLQRPCPSVHGVDAR